MRHPWFPRVLSALLILSYLGFAFLHDPTPGEPSICLFRAVWGIPCPSCGLTHGLHSLLHGDFAGSLRIFPLAFFYALGFGGLALVLLAEAALGKPLVGPRFLQALGWLALGLVMATWILRTLVPLWA